jgi:ABC-type amino acid transport substrate-binding protein
MNGKVSVPIVVIITVVLCGVGAYTVSTTISKMSVPERNTLVVGTSTPFPPFETRAGDKVIGFDMDIAEQIALKLNRRLVIKDFSDFEALLPALKSGSIDIAIAGITILDSRLEVVNFSDPYYNSSQSVLALKTSTLSDLNDPLDFLNLRVGYQTQTTSQYWIESNLNMSNTVSFTDLQMGIQYLNMGEIDVIIIDKPVAEGFTQSLTTLKVVGSIDTKEQYAIAVQKNDPQGILLIINQVLAEMKENGEYNKLIGKWFGG